MTLSEGFQMDRTVFVSDLNSLNILNFSEQDRLNIKLFWVNLWDLGLTPIHQLYKSNLVSFQMILMCDNNLSVPDKEQQPERENTQKH